MKTSPLHLVVFFIIVCFALAGCGNDKIDVDNEQAQGYIISVEQARQYTNSFEQGRADLTRRMGDSIFLRDSFNLPNAEMFSRHAIALLLNAEGAENVRIYLGRDAKGQVRLVLLPVDKDGKNIITRLITTRTAFIPGVSSAYAKPPEDGDAIENGQRCPTMCDEGW